MGFTKIFNFAVLIIGGRSVPYQKHNLGHWNSYLLLTKGALPLKYSIDNGIFTWVAEAIKVEELDLKISEFESPDFIRFSN
ncbi:MAG: hypothetical protein DA408_11020 [Bacteroidetes bacterium]|nr:MAG: hypothetical protein C7N36_10675 [Bacteroidota bacterium]PTM12386.1 MAG: hypothetical protein DA408_11020 [Bacteroidota bacterium]